MHGTREVAFSHRSEWRCARCGECPAEVRPVNVQLAPGFVIQQTQEVPSDERCEQQEYELDVPVRRGMADGDVLTFARKQGARAASPQHLKTFRSHASGGGLNCTAVASSLLLCDPGATWVLFKGGGG